MRRRRDPHVRTDEAHDRRDGMIDFDPPTLLREVLGWRSISVEHLAVLVSMILIFNTDYTNKYFKNKYYFIKYFLRC
jgi:hypothetical protein